MLWSIKKEKGNSMSKLGWLTQKVKKHKKLTIAGVIILILAMVATTVISSAKEKKEQMMAMMNQTQTAKVERRTLVSSVSATGTLTSVNSKDIVVGLNDVEVKSVSVELGDMVEAGQVICEFDSRDVEENLAEAKTALNVTNQKTQMDLTNAERNLANAKEDYDTDLKRANTDLGVAYNDYVEALEDVEEAEAEMIESGYSEMAEQAYEQAVEMASSKLQSYDKQKRSVEDTEKSAENNVISKTDSLTTAQLNALSSGNSEEDKVEQYQQQLDDCTVEAPFSGVISAVNIEAGDTYNGTAIVTIDDISSFEVTAQIDEYDIGKIEKGQKVVIKTNATGDEELEGTVKIVSPKASGNGSEVTYTVIISVYTPSEALRMDMTAKLSIILESKENVLTVPYEAVQEDVNGNYYVEVVDESGDGGEQNSMPEGFDPENMPEMPSSERGGNRTQGMGGKNKFPGSVGKEGTAVNLNTRRIFVEKGIESDYYIEIISNEISEGMEIVVPKTEAENGGNIQMMMMRQGPMGGF